MRSSRLLLLTGSSRSTWLRTLGTILGPAATTSVNAKAVEGSTNNVVTNTRKVLYPTTTHQNDGVLLKIVTLTADIGNDFKAIRETNFGNLTKR
jgi:hypothetical protein